jgi:FkbM family methyltransferase
MILKNFIKKNSLLTIIADYFISFMGFNFEKEYKLINLIKKKFPIIVDIGGNRGESIKNFLRNKKNIKIFCFEPKKKSFHYIKKKYKKKNIKIFNFGIGTKIQSTILYTPTINGYEFSGLSSTDFKNLKFRLNFFFNKINRKFKLIKEKIKIQKLDNFYLKPDLIKIDTEGSELDVIKSSLKTIKKYKPLIIVEYNHINFLNIKKILIKFDYKCYIYEKNNFKLINKKIINEISKRTNLTNIIFAQKELKLNFN